jgi:hypothetical protein
MVLKNNYGRLIWGFALFVVSSLFSETYAFQPKRRYIMMHKNNGLTLDQSHERQPRSFASVLEPESSEYKTLMHTDMHNYASLLLTDNEASNLQKELTSEKGMLVLDEIIQLPNITVTNFNAT